MRTIELPCEECLFAVLSSPSGRGNEARQELVYQFEALLPVPIDSVQMVFSRPFEGKVIACACARDRLGSLSLGNERAVPKSLPNWICDAFPSSVCGQLNLLTGSMKPALHRRRERTTAKAVCFVSLLLALLVALGVQRRSSSLDASLEQTNQQIHDLYHAVLPPRASPGGQPDMIRFAALMNQASLTRSGAEVDLDHALASDLAAVLSSWPSTSQSQVRSVIFDQQGMRLEATLPSNEAAGKLLAALRETPGWEVESHSMTPRADRVELSLRLIKAVSTAKAGGGST